MKRLWLFWGIILVMCCGTVPVFGVASGYILEIPGEVIVAGPKISLADLGTVHGADSTAVAWLTRLDLGQAPLPGQTRVFHRNYLRFLIHQQKSTQLPVLKMGEQVTVRVAATAVRGATIAAAIAKLLPPPGSGILKQWVQINGLPETVWLPQGQYGIEAASVGTLPELGRAVFKVKLVGPAETRVLNLPGVIRQTALVYRAKKALKPLAGLAVADFETVEAELVNGREYRGEFPVNCRTTKTLRPGQVLNREAFQPLPLVTPGQEVKVVVRGNGVMINLTGLAKTEGWQDESIILINPESKKEFRGRVIGNGMAEVTVE